MTDATCTECGRECSLEDEAGCTENDTCVDCHDAWIAEQTAYWKPLYDGEKRAGLLSADTPARAA